MSATNYFECIGSVLERIRTTQLDRVREAGARVKLITLPVRQRVA